MTRTVADIVRELYEPALKARWRTYKIVHGRQTDYWVTREMAAAIESGGHTLRQVRDSCGTLHQYLSQPTSPYDPTRQGGAISQGDPHASSLRDGTASR